MNSQQTITGHRLEINIIKGKELKPTNWFSKTADAFVTLKTQDQVPHQSQVAWKTTKPEWNEKITIELSEKPEEDIVFLEVWGKHVVGSNTFMGRCEIPVSVILKKQEGTYSTEEVGQKWFKLLPKGAKLNFKDFPGSVLVDFKYIYAPLVSPIKVASTVVNTNAQPNNTILYYACPVCKQLFPPNLISNHMEGHIHQQISSLNVHSTPTTSECKAEEPETDHNVVDESVTYPALYPQENLLAHHYDYNSHFVNHFVPQPQVATVI